MQDLLNTPALPYALSADSVDTASIRKRTAYLGVIMPAAIDNLWCHVDWCTHACSSGRVELMLAVAKVTDLQQRPPAIGAVTIQQQVFELQVPVGHALCQSMCNALRSQIVILCA